jgi:hypothetical protein
MPVLLKQKHAIGQNAKSWVVTRQNVKKANARNHAKQLVPLLQVK